MNQNKYLPVFIYEIDERRIHKRSLFSHRYLLSLFVTLCILIIILSMIMDIVIDSDRNLIGRRCCNKFTNRIVINAELNFFFCLFFIAIYTNITRTINI